MKGRKYSGARVKRAPIRTYLKTYEHIRLNSIGENINEAWQKSKRRLNKYEALGNPWLAELYRMIYFQSFQLFFNWPGKAGNATSL